MAKVHPGRLWCSSRGDAGREDRRPSSQTDAVDCGWRLRAQGFGRKQVVSLGLLGTGGRHHIRSSLLHEEHVQDREAGFGDSRTTLETGAAKASGGAKE